MAIRLIESFDPYPTGAVAGPAGLEGNFWNLGPNGIIGISDGTPRFAGSRMLAFNAFNHGHARTRRTVMATPANLLTAQFAIRSRGANDGANNFLAQRDGTPQFSIVYVSATQTFKLKRGSWDVGNVDLQTANDVNILTTNIWHYMEIEADVTSSGYVRVWLDGVQIINYSGNVAQAGVSGWNQVAFGAQGDSWDYDDLIVMDHIGRLGDCRIALLKPVANTAEAGFGTLVGATEAWDALNEQGSDLDTSYIASAVAGVRSVFEVEDLNFNPNSIVAVQARGVSRKEDAGERTMRLSVTQGGSRTDGPPRAMANGYQHDVEIFPTAPDGSAWNLTKVNDAKVGVEIVT